jgi:hypothetical protein
VLLFYFANKNQFTWVVQIFGRKKTQKKYSHYGKAQFFIFCSQKNLHRIFGKSFLQKRE